MTALQRTLKFSFRVKNWFWDRESGQQVGVVKICILSQTPDLQVRQPWLTYNLSDSLCFSCQTEENFYLCSLLPA